MWPRLASVAIGIWLMAAPAVLGYGDPARANDRVVGPIVVSVACVAIWEVARALRWANAVVALWLLIAPWVLGHDSIATANSVAAGMLLLTLATIRGPMRQRFGGGWRALRRAPRPGGMP